MATTAASIIPIIAGLVAGHAPQRTRAGGRRWSNRQKGVIANAVEQERTARVAPARDG